MQDNCKNNAGINTITTYSNQTVYTVKCFDGAQFRYLKTNGGKK